MYVANEKITEQEAIFECIDVMQRNQNAKQERESRNRAIQELLDSGFTVGTVEAPRFIGSKLLYQTIWRTVQRTKSLDFEIHGAGVEEGLERLVEIGVGTTLQLGGYQSILRDKMGAFLSMYTFGDSMIHLGINPNKKAKSILQFLNISQSNIYVDSYATTMRSGGNGRSVKKMAIIFSFDYKTVCKMYPDFKKNGGTPGLIPRDLAEYRELERNEQQTANLKDITEICHFYDLETKTYVCFGGGNMTPITFQHGDDYAYILREEPYIPVVNFMCIPSSQGFWNRGLGDLLYDYAVIRRKLFNGGILTATENVAPYSMLSLPKGKQQEFFKNLEKATQDRAQGKQAFVPVEYDLAGAANQVASSPLSTFGDINAAMAILGELDNELRKCGINLHEIAEMGASPTATQIIQEEETSNAFVKQTMEYNATETEFLMNFVMDSMAEFIPKSNDYPIWATTKIRFEDVEFKPKGLTLGMVADELKKNEYFVKINSRTGNIPSGIYKMAKLRQAIAVAPQGSQAQLKLAYQMALLNDQDIKEEDFGLAPQQGVQPQGEAPMGAPTDEVGAPVLAQTERRMIGGNLTEALPAI